MTAVAQDIHDASSSADRDASPITTVDVIVSEHTAVETCSLCGGLGVGGEPPHLCGECGGAGEVGGLDDDWLRFDGETP